jgi:hypothetical protein
METGKSENKKIKFDIDDDKTELTESKKGKFKIVLPPVDQRNEKYSVFLCQENDIILTESFDDIKNAKNYALKIYAQYNNCSPFVATKDKKGYYPEVEDEIIEMDDIDDLDLDLEDNLFIFIYNNEKNKWEDKYNNFVW